MTSKLKWGLFAAVVVLVAWLQFHGIDRLVLSSDELFRARALISSDWDLFKVAWPQDAVREHFKDWPTHHPPGMGLLMRGAILTLGPSHFAMRFWPWIFGVAGVVMIYIMFQRYCGPRFALWTLIVAGLASDKMFLNAKSVKHYTADVLISAALYIIVWNIIQHNRKRDWALLALTSALGFWIGSGTAFVSAAIFIILFIRNLFLHKTARDKIALWLPIIASGLVVGLSLIGLYFLIVRQAVGNDAFIAHISKSGLQMFDWSQWHQIGYWWKYGLRIITQTAQIPVFFYRGNYPFGIMINALICIWALVQIQRRNWLQMALLLTPYLLVILASFAGKHPLKAYVLITFLMPAWIVMSVSGLRGLYDWLASKQKWMATSMLVAFLAFVGYLSYLNFQQVIHDGIGGGRKVDRAMKFLMENARDQDTAYIHWGAILPFYIYATDHQPGYQNQYPIKNAEAGELKIIFGEEHMGNLAGNEKQFQQVENVPGRLWLVFCHKWPSEEMLALMKRVESRRPLLKRLDLHTCQALLYAPLP